MRCGFVAGLFLVWLTTPGLPVVTLAGLEGETIRGYEILPVGWLGLFQLQFGWYASPLLCGILHSLWHDDGSEGGVGYLVMAGLLAGCVADAAVWRCVVMDEGFGCRAIGRYGIGYYGWLLATAATAGWAATIGSRRCLLRRRMGMI